MSSPRLQTRCRLALNLSHIIFLEAEVELVDPAPCHRPSIKADLPQHTLRSPFFKKGERHSSHIHYTTAWAGSFFPFLTCLSESLQDWQKVLFHCLSKLLPQPYFCLRAPSSDLASLVTLKYYKHHWKKPGKNVKLYLQTFWASRIGSRRGVSLSLLHLCTVHMLSEDWKWQKRQRFNK